MRPGKTPGESMFLPLIITVALAGDFLATSDDAAKMPCVIHLAEPKDCATDPMCVRIENDRREYAVAPSIAGFCSPGEMSVQDGLATMQVILNPRSTQENLEIIPVLAPKGSAFPSVGWTYLPASVVNVSAVAYSGSWSERIGMPVNGKWVNVFDDDKTVDIGDHRRAGVCSVQTNVTAGRNKLIQFGADCSPNELAKSNRR